MAWCPNCRNEYVEGITVCADCGAELVDSLEEVENGKGQPYREEMEPETEGGNEFAEEDFAKEDSKESVKKPVWRSVYQDSAQKAEDNKSSAYTLLGIGALGAFAVILILMGVIPLYQNSATARYFVCGVMGAVFVLFFIFGIVSMKSFKTFSKQAESENSLLAEITKWCGQNLNAQEIDKTLSDMEEMAEEQKYFQRAEKMKQLIQAEFMNLEEAFLDHFVDDYYQNLF